MRRSAPQGSTVVIKVGSSSLALAEGGIDPVSIKRTIDQVISAREAGFKPVLVTSGAVAAALPSLGLRSRPSDLPGLQAAAAVGQGLLMHHYAAGFADHGVVVGQVLLTREVFANRSQNLHARDALNRMTSSGVIPIINENDTVTVDELRFGDNDRLAALVCHVVDASLLVLLTDTAGLFRDDPRLNSSAELVTAVQHNDRLLDELDRATGRGVFGSGGVASKIAAARMAAWSGVPTVIADASVSDVIEDALAGADTGTWIEPHPSSLSARKLWIAFGSPRKGNVTIDEGAAAAVTAGGRSLLPVGVVSIDGHFDVDDAIGLVDGEGRVLAKGLARMDSRSVEEAAGQHSSLVGGEVVHRDDMVVFGIEAS